MKSSTKRILLILFVSLFFLFLARFVFDIFKLKEYLYGMILGISLLSSIGLLGYTKNRNSKEKNMNLAIFLLTLLFQVSIFVVLGWKFGFLRSSYQLGFTHFFKIVLPTVLIIVLSEFLRYQWIEKGRTSKLVLYTVPIFFIFLDFILGSGLYSLSSAQGWFEVIATHVFPSIMRNIFLTYIVYHYGYKPSLIYRLLMELPIYYLPIYPDIGTYFMTVLNISFPFFLLLYFLSYTSSVEIHTREKEKKKKENKKLEFAFQIAFLALLLVFTGMMSGLFHYYFLVVGSGSMEPNIQVGDMVLVEKINEADELQLNDVLVYKKEGKVILHRIVEKKKEDGELIFQTKGDNNPTADAWNINEKEVIGKVNFRIPKVGYPSVWLNELFKGGN